MEVKGKFWISAVVYIANAMAFGLSLFVFSMKDIAGVLFLVFFGYTLWMHFEMKKDGGHELVLCGGWKFLNDISSVLAFLLFVYCVFVTHEGRGTEIGNIYWLRQGSEMIREISRVEYRRLVFAETRLQIGCMLAFTVRPFATYGMLRNRVRCK